MQSSPSESTSVAIIIETMAGKMRQDGSQRKNVGKWE